MNFGGLSFKRIFNGIKMVMSGQTKLDRTFISAIRWFYKRGDETLRLNYPLNKDSVVLDLGGYIGDYADAINSHFGSTVYLYEPMTEFYSRCLRRFAGNSKIHCFPYGLSSKDGLLELSIENDESSFVRKTDGGKKVQAEVRNVIDELKRINVDTIDLMKINIEGGEYDILPSLIESGLIAKIRFVQVQFHKFIPGGIQMREEIRKGLAKTHRESWSYDFIWESWERIS